MGCDLTTGRRRAGWIAFSILERIEWAATLAVHLQNRLQVAFSILERIEWAAPPQLAVCLTPIYLFQYPRTDRMGCDFVLSLFRDFIARLSVSSNGSNGLRL